MSDRFQNSPSPNHRFQFSSSPVRLSNLSPQKYGSTAYKNLTYTPQKLLENHIYRQVIITKKVQNEKNRIRELESLNSLLEEKIRHLVKENETVKGSLELQIEMYKKMLREQEDQARRLIKGLQTQYKEEIERILLEHEKDSMVVQAEKEQLQRRIQDLLSKIDQLQNIVAHGTNTINDLRGSLNLQSQRLINTEDKYSKAQDVARMTIDRLGREIDALNNRLFQQNSNFKQQLDGFNTDKIRQIEALKRLHLTELDKLENKRDAEINVKNLEIRDIKNSFDIEGRRLEDIINNKDRVNEVLGNDLKKEKERVAALIRNYDLEINRLVSQKDHILSDLTLVNDEKNIARKQIQQLAILFQSQRGRSSLVVNSLQGQISKKNLELASQNQHLLRTVQQYQRELAVTSHNANTIHKTIDLERSQEVRRLVVEIRNLKEILLESSREMDKCKDEFLRMEIEREQLIRINHQCEQEAIRLKGIIGEQDVQLRIRRM